MRAARIALIEDNPADVLLIEMALQEYDVVCELMKFESGEEGVKALSEATDLGPDAILLDLNTPKSDGLDVLTKLKECPRLAGVPIAVITSSRALNDKYRIGLQNSRYIEKPSQLKDFLATIGQNVKEMLQEGTDCN